MLRRLAALAALAFAVLAVAPQTAGAASAADLTCGTHTTGGTYRLRHDLTCDYIVFVDAGPVTVDLAGRTYTGTFIGSGDAIVTVRNGRIDGTAVEENAAADLTVDRVHLTGRLTGISGPLKVTRSVVDAGIRCDSCRLVADRNIIRGPVELQDGENFVTGDITSNLIVGGVWVSGFFQNPDATGRIVGNVITGSARAGIELVDGGSTSFAVQRNVIVGNAGDGVHLGPARDGLAGVSTFARNVAVNNGGHGFNLEPSTPGQVVDGGRNRASGNGTAPECIGIKC